MNGVTQSPPSSPRRPRWRRVALLCTGLVLGGAAGAAAVHPAARAGIEGLPDVLHEVRVEVVREVLVRTASGDPGATRMSASSDTPVVPSPPVTPDAGPDSVRPPVLLVPGWSDRASELDAFRSRLLEAGWREDHVRALEFEDPVGSNLDHAREVEQAVDRLRLDLGIPRVDIVAFSMGGLAVRQYLLFEGGAAAARRVIFLGTPHRGTVVAVFAWGQGGREMIPGSPFLERLNADTLLAGVEMASLRTLLDTRVVPGSSAVLPGAANVEVCCPGHAGMLRDLETFELVSRFLLHGPVALTAGEAPPDDTAGGVPATPTQTPEAPPLQGLDRVQDRR